MTPVEITQEDRPKTVGYRIAARTAVVAGVFSVVVCVALTVDYARRHGDDPLDSPEFLALKQSLAENPRDEQLKERIRALDLTLRQQYFRHRMFTHAGGVLLLLGVAVFLGASRSAATLRRKLPMPELVRSPQDTETAANGVARWGVAGLAAVLAATAVALGLGLRTELPENAESLAATLHPTEAKMDEQVPAAAPVDLPTDEEIAKYWPRFRGPDGSGISAYTNLPTAWDAASGEGIRWKTKVPLEGNNSPVVWANRVFLTGASEKRREVYCFDADSGKLLWSKEAPGTPQSTAKPPKVMEDTGFAAPTVATDGRRVYAMFANGDVVALDFAGNVAWSRSLGIPDNAYGHATSLVMYKNLLLIQFDQASVKDEKSKVLALDATTGNTVWEVPRRVPNSWATPLLIRHAGRDQLITTADPWVIAYAPADGKELWRARCLSGDQGVSPVFVDGLLQVGNEYCQWSAIRVDGEGDVTKTHVVWTGEDGLPDTVSPLSTGEFLLTMLNYGTITCYDAKKGDVLWEEEIEADFTSSPSLVGNRVYLFSKKGKGWILEPTREACKHVAETGLGEACVTSPALQDGRIYIRGNEHLFCLEK